MDEEKVFKALADAHRRLLLDVLFERDGRTLSELEAYLPMTRFGVMKHLDVLEEAGLLTTRKIGREKHHYLNPVPIQFVYDRWVSKYAQPITQALSDLKLALEGDEMAANRPAHVYQIFIRTTPEKLWQALTDGTITPQYYFGTRVESTWQTGAAYTYRYADDRPMIEGKILEIDPPRRIVMTFLPRWEDAEEAPGVSRVTFEIEPEGAVCKLTLTHDDLDPHAPSSKGIREGWARILSALKTVLETGETLVEGAGGNR
jgi:uncharacterized protein YndB with AHSA1/START domain/DNA-binding transcriptional ArsR family regulator